MPNHRNTNVAPLGDLTILMRLACEGRSSEIAEWLGRGEDVHARTHGGCTALMFAAANGHSVMVEALRGAGADIHAKDNDGFTALMYAAENGHMVVAEALWEAGADIHATNGNVLAAPMSEEDHHAQGMDELQSAAESTVEGADDAADRGDFRTLAEMVAYHNGGGAFQERGDRGSHWENFMPELEMMGSMYGGSHLPQWL